MGRAMATVFTLVPSSTITVHRKQRLLKWQLGSYNSEREQQQASGVSPPKAGVGAYAVELAPCPASPGRGILVNVPSLVYAQSVRTVTNPIQIWDVYLFWKKYMDVQDLRLRVSI